MAEAKNMAYGAGVGEQESTGGKLGERALSGEELTEDEVKELAREYTASWQMPPSGLYIFNILAVSEKVEALSKGGKEYTYRQILGHAHGRTGNLEYSGYVLMKILGNQAEIFAKIARSDIKKCLVDIRRWNNMQRVNGVFSLERILELLRQNGDSEAQEIAERIE